MKENTFPLNHNFFFHYDDISENTGHCTMQEHIHTLFEIYYITRGSCRYFIENKTYQLYPGDIVLIPAGIIHNTEYDNTNHSRILINCNEDYIPLKIRPQLNSLLYLYRNPTINDELDMIFQKISDEYNQKDALRDDILRCYIHTLFFLIIRNQHTCSAPDTESDGIVRAIEYLKKNFTHKLSLSTVAETIHISPEHLSRKFKQATGFGFNEYLNLLRLRKAEAIIKRPNSPNITEIAEICGFNDSNYFSQKFKAFYGISPKKMQLSVNKNLKKQ